MNFWEHQLRENGFFSFENVRFERSTHKTYVLYRDTRIFKGDAEGEFVSIEAIDNNTLKENAKRVDKVTAQDIVSGKQREIDKRRKISIDIIKELQHKFRAEFGRAKAFYDRSLTSQFEEITQVVLSKEVINDIVVNVSEQLELDSERLINQLSKLINDKKTASFKLQQTITDIKKQNSASIERFKQRLGKINKKELQKALAEMEKRNMENLEDLKSDIAEAGKQEMEDIIEKLEEENKKIYDQLSKQIDARQVPNKSEDIYQKLLQKMEKQNKDNRVKLEAKLEKLEGKKDSGGEKEKQNQKNLRS